MRIDNSAKIDASVRIEHNVVVMRNVVIAKNASLGSNAVIYPDTTIGAGTKILDGSIIGRPPLATGSIDRKISDNLKGLAIGDGCVVGAHVILYAGSNIGRNVLISDLSSIREECFIGNDVVIGRSVIMNYNIVIGDRCRIMDGCHFGGDMVLEEDVFFGPYVCSANDNYMGLRKEGLVRCGPKIRKGARIGANTTLLANIEIGEESVIGAGSLVTRSIPARSLAYGSPAEVIKSLASMESR